MDKIESIYRLLPILNIGTYHGGMNPDNHIYSEDINDDRDEGYINYTSDEFWCDGFDSAAYNKKVLESAQHVVDDLILPVFQRLDLGITDIKITGMDSPKFYNFRDDWLEYDIIIKDRDKLVKKLLCAFNSDETGNMNSFFHEHYGSYDGFHSFMSSDAGSILQGLEQGEDDEICQFLYYIFLDAGHTTEFDIGGDWDTEEWNEALYDVFRQDFRYTEFVLDEFENKYEEGRTETVAFIKENYNKYGFDKMVQVVGEMTERLDTYDDSWFGDGLEMTTRIVKRAFNEIESKNLKINFDN